MDRFFLGLLTIGVCLFVIIVGWLIIYGLFLIISYLNTIGHNPPIIFIGILIALVLAYPIGWFMEKK